MLNFFGRLRIPSFEVMAGQKYFFIGASKMCTSSIAAALKQHGKAVVHGPRFGLYSHINEYQDHYFSSYDYFLDGNLHNFNALEKWFPDAKFILLDRQEENWLLSMYNWLRQIDSENRSLNGERYVKVFNRLVANRWMFLQITMDMLLYRKRVLSHFKGKKNFLHLNIEKENRAGWQRLSRFIGLPLDIRWENIQTEKICPEWINGVVTDARNRISEYEVHYPTLKKGGFRDWVFLKVMRSISIHFIRERHLGRNIHEAFCEHGMLKGFYRSGIHLIRFFQMVGCLILRILVNRERRLCPYLI